MQLQYPTKFFHITQKFGAYGANYRDNEHHGLDLRVSNDPAMEIYAAQNGEVVYVDTSSDFNWYNPMSWGKGSPYGNHIIIKHVLDGKTYFTLYGHLTEPLVKVGEVVGIGQHIGKGGNTGMSKGPHLHFELREGVNDVYHTIDPEPYLTGDVEEEVEIPKWAKEAVTWVRATGLFQITNQNDVRDAVKFHRLYKLLKT